MPISEKPGPGVDEHTTSTNNAASSLGSYNRREHLTQVGHTILSYYLVHASKMDW
jgi:hypothetical protein